MKNKEARSPGRREFIRNAVISGTGVFLAPSLLSCNSRGIVSSTRDAAAGESNLLFNGNFEMADPEFPQKPAGWETGPHQPGTSVALSDEGMEPGSQSVIQRRTVTPDYHYFLRQSVSLNPGSLYRLRFHIKADELSKDLFSVCIAAQGEEGPAWLYRPIEINNTQNWQEVDILFCARSGFNPINAADIEFRLYQWRPDFMWRPNRPQDRNVRQQVLIDSVSLVKVNEGSRVPGRAARRLLVPEHDSLKMANVELGLGDGISMVQGSLNLEVNGRNLNRVEFLEDISRPGFYAYSERSKRLFIHKNDSAGYFKVTFEAVSDPSGDGLSGISSLTGRALGKGTSRVTRINLNFDKKDFNRAEWPVTQGLPFPEGVLADMNAIRVVDPKGNEVPCQLKSTSFWADDSVRWALLDFCINAKAGETPLYIAEFGPGIKRSDINNPIVLTDNENEIIADSGRLKFRVSKKRFLLLEDLRVDGRPVLEKPAAISTTDQNGEVYTTDREKPYAVAIEENGPLRATIAVAGWNANQAGKRFMTYTTRIHIYRNQPFVRVFHSLTNRHEEQVIGEHKFARGWPEKEDQMEYKKLPQLNIADASIRLNPADIQKWSFITGKETIEGNTGTGTSMHRQTHHAEGLLVTPAGNINTGAVPGIIKIDTKKGSITTALFRYANLFPKELRINKNSLEIGIIPFTTETPHPILKGTARTTELMFAFDTPDNNTGIEYARAFCSPSLFSNQQWYCQSNGFMGDRLIPVNDKTIGTYDRIINSYVENCSEPYPKGVDDCGLMNFGDFTYTGYNIWVNLEYDSDLGLYMHFARSGDNRAFLRGQDASRHFLDSDTAWYTGDFETHGCNFPHNVLHFAPGRPAGHIYTLGLIHYYLLSGDRRALEATRMASDCVYRVLHHRVHQYASVRTEEDPVGPKRGHHIPGGSYRSANSRNTSDPSRYTLHSYLATGEARFLDASMSLAESLVLKWPEAWRTDDDQYIHYRWPQVIGRLYDLTGEEHFRDIIIKCGNWMLEGPYAKYGEFRVSQSYGRGVQVSGANNTRMMFLTAWAWKITGERKYLDWMINMFDFLIERDRYRNISRTSGKDLGKEADNPARGAAWVVPYRTILIDHSPSRFNIVTPFEGLWRLTIGNTSETPLTGKLRIGPIPRGVKMKTSEEFELDVKKETTLEFKVSFGDEVDNGRITIPYNITTLGTDNRTGERNSFFAAHIIKPRNFDVPELLFHAPLNSHDPVYAYGGDPKPVIEVEDYIEGRMGKEALGENSEGWSFNLTGSIFPDKGTFSVWVKPAGFNREHGILRVLGYGWPFIGIYTHTIVACNQPFTYQLSNRSDEWLHIAIRWDINEIGYFIDGRSVFLEKRVNYEIPTGELWGMPQEAAAFQDVKIYSVPLSDEKIRSLAETINR